ncbi:cation diffusion facilitator family transporter [Paramicrobacterium agarici]|uniref:Cation diffusion facilitator family transporter n=1 Tax=Paramicrobacterium agarici TaxID=630514 RepID=A0A2A9DRU8_9MICO|nr:cation diffusion facilitator family transporter [Microbacterium agarici]PFG29314.1 cation diffusion facilitator family transporter [Microbacterium agarici]
MPAPHNHTHSQEHDGAHGHSHSHKGGFAGFIAHLFVPHSHDASDSIDDALEASTQGIRAVKISLIALGATALLQGVIVALSGSIALLADTIHNFSDALTAIPLWIAFSLSRRAATPRYTWGFGRAEDLAGLFIVAMIALSAVLAAVESVHRLLEPRPLEYTGWVFAAGLLGFAGNELVAIYRIRTGRRIGSAALVADGVHARTDGFTSLAVVLGVVGVWLGFPWADPAIGILISLAIVVLLIGTARDVGRRLLDGVDPDLTRRARDVLAHDSRVIAVDVLRLRWNGHRLTLQATVTTSGDLSVDEFHSLEHDLTHRLGHALPGLGDCALTPQPGSAARA